MLSSLLSIGELAINASASADLVVIVQVVEQRQICP